MKNVMLDSQVRNYRLALGFQLEEKPFDSGF